MANIEFQELEGKNILDKLIERGVIIPYTFRYSGRKQHQDYVLDYERCDAEKWAKQKESILEKGVLDTIGGVSVRRSYTETEERELGLYPLLIKEDSNRNFVGWRSKWAPNDDPAYYISRALPEDILKLRFFYEGRADGSICIKNGEQYSLSGKKAYAVIRHIKRRQDYMKSLHQEKENRNEVQTEQSNNELDLD